MVCCRYQNRTRRSSYACTKLANFATTAREALSFTFNLARNCAEWMENGQTTRLFFTVESASIDEGRRLSWVSDPPACVRPGNKMHAPEPGMSKPNLHASYEGNAISVSEFPPT